MVNRCSLLARIGACPQLPARREADQSLPVGVLKSISSLIQFRVY